MDPLNNYSTCRIFKSIWKFMVGIALFLSVISLTSWGDVADALWFSIRVIGSVAIILSWIGIVYDYIKCNIKYEMVHLVFAIVLSILLMLIYVSTPDIDKYTFDALRYYIFSAFTHLLLFTLPSLRN